jgi:hypothetical protein
VPLQSRWPGARLSSDNVLTQSGGTLHEEISFGSMMALHRAGCKRDRRVRLHASPHPGISDVVERTLRGSPA